MVTLAQQKVSYLLILWFFLPSFLMAVASLPSLAIGLLATSVIGGLPTLLSDFRRRIQVGRYYLMVLGAVAVSVLMAHFAAGQPFSSKQGSSFLAVAVLGFLVPTMFHYYFSRKARDVARELRWTYLLLIFIGLVGIVLPFRVGPYEALAHPVFPFLEPSHYGLAYAQVASITLPFMKRGQRMLVVIVSFILALGFPNVTMLVTALLLLMVTAPVWSMLVLLALSVPVGMLVSTVAPDAVVYFMDRISGSGGANLSRLVYMQGWESLVSANVATNGIGIGFQNLGNEPEGAASIIIRSLTGDASLNRADGGFLIAKIGGELGIVGIIVSIFLVFLSVLSGKKMRDALKRDMDIGTARAILPFCSTYIFLVEMLVRGVGYFSPSLFLAAYFIPKALAAWRNKETAKTALRGGARA